MKIKKLRIQNYRLLKDVSLTLSEKSTVIVGRNNTGKTSLTEIFRSFLSNKPTIKYEDFNLSSLPKFGEALKAYQEKKDEPEIRKLLPTIELELILEYTDDQQSYGALSDFILDLNETQTETSILIQQQLGNGKIKSFFEGLSLEDTATYYRELKTRIGKFFETKAFAIDPLNPENRTAVEFAKVNRVLLASFVNAQRGLDDETHNEKDVLGKSLENIFRSASLENAPEEFKATSKGVNDVVNELQSKVDTDFQSKLKDLLPSLELFGYPGLGDSDLGAQTELKIESLLKSDTKVFYEKGEALTLPETYNGLGFRNLIFILFRIYEFFRTYQSSEQEPKGHVIFIEEPEAHLHPQMQEVFIRQLDQIVAQFVKELNNDKKWPVQFVVSTHSTHLANEVDFNQVRYFLSKGSEGTKIKDLSSIFAPETEKTDRDFVHKYLTLTKCDLYFADKAILAEGATERILMPEIIKKIDEKHSTALRSDYMSIVEIGGAYAHRFYKFLDFLELKTLVITDLDSVKTETKDKNGGNRVSYPACPVSEGSKSSNTGISNWFDENGHMDLAAIIGKSADDKEKSMRRICYQVPEENTSACARSFEDAFILANTTLFDIKNSENETELELNAFEVAQKVGESGKADFAIQYAIENTEWSTPKYIEDGLLWLVSAGKKENETAK